MSQELAEYNEKQLMRLVVRTSKMIVQVTPFTKRLMLLANSIEQALTTGETHDVKQSFDALKEPHDALTALLLEMETIANKL